MLPWSGDLGGELEQVNFASELLKGNPLGDPHERPLLVYTPPGYAEDEDRRFPVVYVLQGWAGQVRAWHNRTPFRQPFTETADAVFATGQAPPAVLVYVDAWTAYGGSQFVDSPAVGPYHSYLCDEIVPWVDAHYRTLPKPGNRAIMGKSSGGFGAMITPMLRPDLFGALATHAGDALYELSFLPEFGKAVRALRRYDGDVWRWWEEFNSRVAFVNDDDSNLAELLCMAACWSANPDGSFELPFDTRTGVIREEAWARWLNWDPVRMAPAHAEALRGLRGIWIDAGVRDEWYLDIGAEAFREALREVGVADEKIHFELFDATHMAIEYRYPLSLAWLCERIAP
jgi:S-formylglutathione hydrolase FrmB